MRSYLKTLRIPMVILLMALAITLVSRHYDISSCLNIEFIQQSQIDITIWSKQHVFLADLMYLMLVALLSIPMMMPGVIFIPIIGGFFLGFWQAFLLSMVGVTFSFCIKFIFFHQLYGLRVGKKSPKYSQRVLGKISRNFNKYKLYYFLLLRLIPGFPSWVFSGVAVNANMKLLSFLTWVFFGTMPATALYVYVGISLVDLLHGEYDAWQQILLSPQIYWPALTLLVIILFSFFYCFIKEKKRKKPNPRKKRR